MITIRDGQVWVCVRTKRTGRMLRVTGLHSVTGNAALLTYASVNQVPRSTGKIDARELRRSWWLVSCGHTDLPEHCVLCACAFHGVRDCDCVAEARA